MEASKVYVVKCSKGLWDDYSWWIGGIFTYKTDANKFAERLNQERADILDLKDKPPIEYSENLSEKDNEIYFDWYWKVEGAKESHLAEVIEYDLNG